MNDQQINEYIIKRANAQENYIACYLRETGLKASDIVLVEQTIGLTTTWYCVPKAERPNIASRPTAPCGDDGNTQAWRLTLVR